MGYDIRFEGQFTVSPPFTPAQQSVLMTFARTGRTPLEAPAGAAPVEALGLPGEHGATWVRRTIEPNHLLDDQLDGPKLAPRTPSAPPSRCCWRPVPGGHGIEWDGCEKFTGYSVWLEYLDTTFFKPWGRTLEGSVSWEGEDGARGTLSITANGVEDVPEAPETSVDEEVRMWIASLDSEDARLRADAVRSLPIAVDASSAVRAQAVTALTKLLDDRSLLKEALEALGELGAHATSVMPRAMELLADANPQVRYWATFALGRMGAAAQAAIPALRKLTADSEYGPKYGAIDALSG